MPPCAAASPLHENISYLQGACVHIAIYHFEAKVISRGSGRSAVAAAAYQSGSKLYNDYTGLTHDYRKKGGVLYSEILLPVQAPKNWQDRQTFWNAVEQAEKTKDSRLARQLIVALPAELEQADWKAMLHGFIQRQCVDRRMCADWAIHDPDGSNPHAHIMLTMRPLDRNGHWQAKTQKEYLCRRGQEEKGFTAQEFLQAKKQGWEKQYKYKSGSASAWLTPTEAAQRPGWTRSGKQPKATRFGRQNPVCERWNSQGQLVEWRGEWAETVNRALEEKGRAERVSHLSFAAQGMEEQPTVHEGYVARTMEQRGLVADRCEINRQIKADNKLLRELKANLKKLVSAAENSIAQVAATLERLRTALILVRYRMEKDRRQEDDVGRKVKFYRPRVQQYREVSGQIKDKDKERRQMQTDKQALNPLQLLRQRQLAEQISALTEEIEELKSQKAMLLREMQCEGSADVERLERHLRQLDEISEKLAARQSRLTDEWRNKLDAFDGARRSVTGRTKTKELLQERARLRPEQRKALAARLQEQEGERLDDGLARWAETLVDDALGYEEGTVRKLEFGARMRKDAPKQEHAARARRQQELSL